MRSRSEVLGLRQRPASGDVSYLTKPLEGTRPRSGSAWSLVEHVLQDEGMDVTPDDTLVRVAEQEIAEAFDIPAEELNEAACRLLMEENPGAAEEREEDDTEKVNALLQELSAVEEEGEKQATDASKAALWRDSLKTAPDSCIVITDL